MKPGALIPILALLPIAFCYAADSPGSAQAQRLASATIYLNELALVCVWTPNEAEIVRRHARQAITDALQQRVLHGELIPGEAVEAQAYTSAVSVNLSHRVAVKDRDTSCVDPKWKEAWKLFETSTQSLPADSPERYPVPEYRELQFSQFAARVCIMQAAELLDDHLSGADVVATAAAEACRGEIERFAYAQRLSQGHDTSSAKDFSRRFPDSDSLRRAVTTQVLQQRGTPAVGGGDAGSPAKPLARVPR